MLLVCLHRFLIRFKINIQINEWTLKSILRYSIAIHSGINYSVFKNINAGKELLVIQILYYLFNKNHLPILIVSIFLLI